MARIIHCARHAQGVHNLSYSNHNIPDPSLTPYGERQCHEIAVTFPYHDEVELVVASPLRRTICTALLGFELEASRGVQVLALPSLQEASSLPCDTGSDFEPLQKEFENTAVDLGLVEEGWQVKTDASLTSAALFARAERARKWLRDRPENNIVVVSHGCFLHFLTDDWKGSLSAQATGWSNAEFRSYELSSDGDSTLLRETAESKERRGVAACDHESEEERLLERKKTIDIWSTWGIVTG
ncbi:phosphoglycerate mutase [Alternaria rosae]|uniref:phosphoglycerate mutase n=1 Tax=Alternaria rosae TaxID=1187941 RepID=UPI001E8CAB11|nr:phosphoglycerate mutase [Alternaria rosae]KAH6864807.1 phosphoglycerate mutase [Alternaria rosae]